MLHKRLMHAAVIATVGAIALAGCTATTDGGGGGTVAPITDPTASLEGVTLELWAAETTATAADQPIKAFEEATGAKVNVVVVPGSYDTALPTKLATGATPDLMFWQPTTQALGTIRGSEILQPLTDELWVQNYSDAAASLGVVDGERIAAMITAPSAIGIYYNKDVFKEAGITDIPTNYDDLIAAAKKITAAGTPAFYEVGADKWPLQWLSSMLLAETTKSGDFWPSINTNSGKTWGSPETVGAFTSYEDDVIKGGLAQPDFQNGTFTDQVDALYTGRVAMAAQLNAVVSVLLGSYTPEEIDSKIGFFPISRDGDISTYVAGQDNAIVAPKTGDAAQEAAARQFIAFWLGPDYADYIKSAGLVSIMNNVDSPAEVPAVSQANFDSIANGVGAFQMESLVVCNGIVDYLQEMIYGTKTPQEVGDACQAEIVQIAQAQGLPGF